MANPTVRDSERVKRIGKIPRWQTESKVLVPLAAKWGNWRRIQTRDWGGDKATRRSVSGGVIMRGGHCLKVWTRKQQMVSLSSAESELYAAVKTASGRAWGPERGQRTWAYLLQ